MQAQVPGRVTRRRKRVLWTLLGATALVLLGILAIGTDEEPRALDVHFPDGDVWRVPEGGSAPARVVLTNAGTRPLEVTLWLAAGGPDAAWLAFTPETTRVTVPAGGQTGVEFTVHARPGAGAREGVAALTLSWIEANHRRTRTPAVLVRTDTFDEHKPDPLTMAVAGAAGGALAWLVVRLGWSRLRGALAAFALYSRIDRGEALENENRRKVMDAIAASPGIHFSELMRRTGMPNGALYHHLRILEQNGHVTSRRQAGRRVYAPMGATLDPPASTTPAERRILDLLPPEGMTLAELANGLGITRQRVAYHVLNLEERGLLHKRMVQGGRRCFPAEK